MKRLHQLNAKLVHQKCTFNKEINVSSIQVAAPDFLISQINQDVQSQSAPVCNHTTTHATSNIPEFPWITNSNIFKTTRHHHQFFIHDKLAQWASRAEYRPSPTPHCCIEFRLSLSLRVMLGIRLMWSSTQLPTQRSISARTAGSLAPESNRSFALSLQCIVHLVRRSCEGRDTIICAINTSIKNIK